MLPVASVAAGWHAASSCPLLKTLMCLPAVDDKQATMQLLGGTWRLIYSSGFSTGSIGGTRPGPPAGEQCSHLFDSPKLHHHWRDLLWQCLVRELRREQGSVCWACSNWIWLEASAWTHCDTGLC